MDAAGLEEKKQRALWGFAAFCVVSAVVGVAGSAYATGWPSLLRLWVHDLVASLVLGTVAFVNGAPRPAPAVLKAPGWWLGIFFVVTPVFYAAVGDHLGSSATTLVFGAVPFLTVFLVAQQQGRELNLLAPAVVTLGGLALVVPFAWPASNVGVASLGVMVFCAGVLAFTGIGLHKQLQDISILWTGALGCGVASLLGFVAWLALQRDGVPLVGSAVAGEMAWGALVDAPLVLLTVWLLKLMQPEGFATRFAIVPMISVSAGIAVMRSPVAWTTWLGLVLVLGGSWLLLRAEGAFEPHKRHETGDRA